MTTSTDSPPPANIIVADDGAPTGLFGTAFDPRELWRTLLIHRWLIASVTAGVLLLTAIYGIFATPYYRTTVRVLIERDAARGASIEEIYNLGSGAADYYVTQYKILESRAVAAAALERLPAQDRAWFEQSSDPIAAFAGLRRVLPVPKSRLVDVRTEHPDPEVSQRMAQALVDAYIANVQGRKSEASNSALVRLRGDAESLQEKLITAQKASQEFKTRNGIVSMNDRQSLTAAKLEQLSDELSEISRRRREAEAKLQIAQDAVSSPTGQPTEAGFATTNSVTALHELPEVLESRVIAEYKRELVEARQALSSLAQNYKPKHPRMLALARRIEAIDRQLDGEIQSICRGLSRTHDRLVVQENEVTTQLENQTKALVALEQKTIQHQILDNEAANIRRLYDAVLARLKEVEIIYDDETTNVHRIGSPETSHRPVRPRRVLNLLLALFGGLMLGFGAAFAVDLSDRSVKTPADATHHLGLPVLGLIPRLEGKRVRRGPLDPETLDPKSTMSEAFRTVRTAMTFSEAGRDMRSLVVTSASPEEGKSMVSINLAVSYARAGKRVLLIDADMRRPRLHRAFELEAEEGFSSLLLDSTRDLESLVLPTKVDGLFMLPCGLIPPDPVELLQNGMTQELLDLMTEAFDLVVFDSPPVGIISDACVLGVLVDRAIFVVRSFKTDRSHCKRALDSLRKVGTKLAGLILNVSDQRADRYGRYDYEYSYSYSARYEEIPTEEDVVIPSAPMATDHGAAGNESTPSRSTTSEREHAKGPNVGDPPVLT